MSDRVTKGDLKVDLGGAIQAKKQRTSGGGGGIGGTGNVGMLGVAKVVTINYEEFTVTLRVVLGEDQEFQRVPVPMTFPGAGKRHFFGAMPEEGDYCVIGHISQETDGRTATPVILAWVLPGTWMGHDWMVGQPFAPSEYSMDAKDTFFGAGAFQRSRHKLRHMEPGNIVCSSSQGADLVLNEEVHLINRRGNEIILRDPDQAIVMRALQKFESLSGTRTYSGMVQRDAMFLPSQMFSDGVPWEGSRQINVAENRPWTDEELQSFGTSNISHGDLIPNVVFEKRTTDGLLGDCQSGVFFESNLDPYDFLQKGGFISNSGRSIDGRESSDAVYGGKSFFRVSSAKGKDGKPENGVLSVYPSYTEHRVEVAHTSDGRLPVTEQTDGFDAERLPRTPALSSQDTKNRNTHAPFIEHVMGTVVGNDPYSKRGREQYGVPLKPVIFDGSGGVSPSMEGATNAEVDAQAATMTRVYPPAGASLFAVPTFFGVRKDGRFYGSIGGPSSSPFSAEIAMQSGARINMGGKLVLEFEGLELNSPNGDPQKNLGFNLTSNRGAVRIYGGGNTTDGELAARTSPSASASALADLPSVSIEGGSNVHMKASKVFRIESVDMLSSSQRAAFEVISGISFNAGDKISSTSKTFDQIVNGKATYNFHGPKDNLPTNGSFRSTTISGIGIGAVDEYLVVQGDRTEEFLLGNHTTTVQVGNLTYETNAGQWSARAGTNQLSVDIASGMSGQIAVGNITLDALAGSTSLSGSVSFTARTPGAAVVSGGGGITLGGPGKIGGIVSGSDLDPLTGAPLASFGMGSPGHFLGAPINMALTPATITSAILSAAPQLAGPTGLILATVVGNAVYTWATGGIANVALVGVTTGVAGVGVVTSLPGQFVVPPNVAVLVQALTNAGVVGPNAALVAQGVAVGVATAFTSSAQYTGPSVGVASGIDNSIVTVANASTLIPLLALGFPGASGPIVSNGIGIGIANLLLLGSSLGAPVTGPGGGIPAVGTSGPSTIF